MYGRLAGGSAVRVLFREQGLETREVLLYQLKLV